MGGWRSVWVSPSHIFSPPYALTPSLPPSLPNIPSLMPLSSCLALPSPLCLPLPSLPFPLLCLPVLPLLLCHLPFPKWNRQATLNNALFIHWYYLYIIYALIYGLDYGIYGVMDAYNLHITWCTCSGGTWWRRWRMVAVHSVDDVAWPETVCNHPQYLSHPISSTPDQWSRLLMCVCIIDNVCVCIVCDVCVCV